MSIKREAHDAFDQSLTNFKDANPTASRAQRRKFVAELVNRGNEWLAKFDAQDNAAPADFAASRAAQFNTYLDALPDVTLDVVDAEE